jgi:hypothetical protein
MLPDITQNPPPPTVIYSPICALFAIPDKIQVSYSSAALSYFHCSVRKGRLMASSLKCAPQPTISFGIMKPPKSRPLRIIQPLYFQFPIINNTNLTACELLR